MAETAQPEGPMQKYRSGSYWNERSDMIYYKMIDYIVRAVGRDAKSIVDVGSGNCPYLEWFDWIPEKVSVDIGVPYSSDRVKGVQGDIFDLDFGKPFDVCTCLQVLEHVPDAGSFAKRLLELSDLVIVSVPFEWVGKIPGHVHDPVSYDKLVGWMGREANYKIIAEEPFRNSNGKRLIAIFDKDTKRRFGPSVRKGMMGPRNLLDV